VLAYPGEPLDTALRRFVVARKDKLDAVLVMLRAHLVWFSEQQVGSLRALSAAGVLEVAPEVVHSVDSAFPHYHAGHDKDGRPVTYIHGCSYSAAHLFSLVAPDRVARYHTWRTERMLAGMYARLQAGTPPLPTGQLAVVIDLNGMTMRHVDKQFLGLIKLLAVVDQAHYPERLGKMYICGVSRIFFVVWRMVRPWLDARTASKICFLTSDEVDAGALLDSIDAALLPVAYGGAAPNPWDKGPNAEEDSLPGDASGDATSSAAAAADAGRVTPTPGPAAQPPSHRRGGSGWSSAGSGSSPAKGLPPSVGSGIFHGVHHGPQHSRSTSADFALAQRRLGTYHHRRTPSDDVASVASFLSAGGSSMHDYESDTEFLDAVDAYVELRMGEVSDGGDGGAAGTSGALSPDASVIAEVTKVLAHSGDALPDSDASAGGHMHPHAPHPAPSRSQHTAAPPPGRSAGRGRSSASSSSVAGAGAKRPPALPAIPEVVIKEVKGRLNRVRLLLDCTNVLTLITSIVLLSLNDTGTNKLTGGPLRAFGGVIMSVSLVSLLVGITMVWSAGSLCIACRYLARGRAAVEVEKEEGEDAV
jgi:hypothetical protein